jgi:hypothetical protein
VATPTTPSQRLRAAIEDSPYSIRSLSIALSRRPDVNAAPESIRRSLSRWLRGEPIGNGWAVILEDQLGLPADSLIEPNFSRAVSLAGQLVRRLEAGESLPPGLLVQVAVAAEEAGQAAYQFAAFLRREAAAHG